MSYFFPSCCHYDINSSVFFFKKYFTSRENIPGSTKMMPNSTLFDASSLSGSQSGNKKKNPPPTHNYVKQGWIQL